jgi:hypothetical protein
MVEISPEGLPVRIFKNAKRALDLPPERVSEWPKKEAVGSIRHQIFVRCAGKCEYGCGRSFPEDGPLRVRMHMHEEVPKGSVHTTGEVSLANSKAICYYCHFEDDPRGHQNRRLHFGETIGEKGWK